MLEAVVSRNIADPIMNAFMVSFAYGIKSKYGKKKKNNAFKVPIAYRICYCCLQK